MIGRHVGSVANGLLFTGGSTSPVISLYGSPKPVIIFLDINMPGMTGWDFLEEYKELSSEIHERAVVAMLTTSVNPDDKERGSSIPEVKEFAHKPLTPEVFWKVVHENFS